MGKFSLDAICQEFQALVGRVLEEVQGDHKEVAQAADFFIRKLNSEEALALIDGSDFRKRKPILFRMAAARMDKFDIRLNGSDIPQFFLFVALIHQVHEAINHLAEEAKAEEQKKGGATVTDITNAKKVAGGEK